MNILFRRRSVRAYTDQEIEKEKIDLILRAGMQAPSARNQRPWRFLVIQNRKDLARLANVTPNLKILKDAQAAIFTFFVKKTWLHLYLYNKT